MFAIISKEIGNLWYLDEAVSPEAAMKAMAEELDGGLYDWFFFKNADKSEMDYLSMT